MRLLAVLTCRSQPDDFHANHSSTETLTAGVSFKASAFSLPTKAPRKSGRIMSPSKVKQDMPIAPASMLTCAAASPRNRDLSPKWQARLSSAIWFVSETPSFSLVRQTMALPDAMMYHKRASRGFPCVSTRSPRLKCTRLKALHASSKRSELSNVFSALTSSSSARCSLKRPPLRLKQSLKCFRPTTYTVESSWALNAASRLVLYNNDSSPKLSPTPNKRRSSCGSEEARVISESDFPCLGWRVAPRRKNLGDEALGLFSCEFVRWAPNCPEPLPLSLGFICGRDLLALRFTDIARSNWGFVWLNDWRKCCFRRSRSAMLDRSTADSADCWPWLYCWSWPSTSSGGSLSKSTSKDPHRMTKNSLPISPARATTVPLGTSRRVAMAAMSENVSLLACKSARRFTFLATALRINSTSSFGCCCSNCTEDCSWLSVRRVPSSES
mmetsp:Transcript_18139/g.54204  ORF Transcript_18139/g.54204 Transcript_18139/m.54204 type:complete len:441 (+) Transcript_18139:1065-2387(+)